MEDIGDKKSFSSGKTGENSMLLVVVELQEVRWAGTHGDV